jgi:hypothetical protein
MIKNRSKRSDSGLRTIVTLLVLTMIFSSLALLPQKTYAASRTRAGSRTKIQLVTLDAQQPKKLGNYYFKTSQKYASPPIMYSSRKNSGYRRLSKSMKITPLIRYGNKLYYGSAGKKISCLYCFNLKTGSYEKLHRIDARSYYKTKQSFISGRYILITGYGYTSFEYPRTYVINAATGKIKEYDIFVDKVYRRWISCFTEDSNVSACIYKWNGRFKITRKKVLNKNDYPGSENNHIRFYKGKVYYSNRFYAKNSFSKSKNDVYKILIYDLSSGKTRTVKTLSYRKYYDIRFGKYHTRFCKLYIKTGKNSKRYKYRVYYSNGRMIKVS